MSVSDVETWLQGYTDAERAPPARAVPSAPTIDEERAQWLDGAEARLRAWMRTERPGLKLEAEQRRRIAEISQPAPWERWPATEDGAAERYLNLVDVSEPYDAAAGLRAEVAAIAAQGPLGGLTAGQLAELHTRHFSRQAQDLRALRPGSGVDTELRETLAKIKGLEPFAERAAMLRSVQRIARLGNHRVKVCLRYMTRQGPTEAGERVVEVVQKAPKEGSDGSSVPSPRYRGVALCGNGWVCPVCASRITEGRREQLAAGVGAWRQGKLAAIDPEWPDGRPGGAALLLTFTFSHGQNDELKGAWGQLGRALQRFARHPDVKRFRAELGWVGRIRAREVTYGINGWHPHAHTLELVDGALADPETLDTWTHELKRVWADCCSAVGLSASYEHGFALSLTDVDTYIAKWGVDAELAKWHIKRGRPNLDAPAELGLNGYSPFDLLRIHAGELEANPQLKLTRDRAAALFAEYALAVKGTAQLHWTRGLRALLGVADISDAQLAARDEPEPEVLGTLTPRQWFAVVSGNHQIEFLGLVAVKGWLFASRFLDYWRDELDRHERRSVRGTIRNRGVAYLYEGGSSGKRRNPNSKHTRTVGSPFVARPERRSA